MSEKKFREILDDGIEGNLWKPTSIGTQIKGKILQIEEWEYGIQALIRTPDGYEILLPAHQNLQRKLKQIQEGDYIRVTLQDIKKSNNPQYHDKLLYKLEVAEKEEKRDVLEWWIQLLALWNLKIPYIRMLMWNVPWNNGKPTKN